MRLGVNVDHVATIRQARGTSYPDPVDAARRCVEAGAHGITIHLREDRRHIQDHDVHRMKEMLSVPLNLEMAHAEEIITLALETSPEEVCLVPERREELTTEGGLDVAGQQNALRDVVERLRGAGSLVSMFVEADSVQLEASKAIGAPCVELHTGAFCDARGAKAAEELDKLIKGSRIAHEMDLQVNAGHGINMETIGSILTIPHLDTLNIGHSIVARALLIGMHAAVQEMLEAMAGYRDPGYAVEPDPV